MSFIDELRELADRLEKYEEEGFKPEVKRITDNLLCMEDEAYQVAGFAKQALEKIGAVKNMADAEAYNEWSKAEYESLNKELKHIKMFKSIRK